MGEKMDCLLLESTVSYGIDLSVVVVTGVINYAVLANICIELVGDVALVDLVNIVNQRQDPMLNHV